ncbi:MAG: CrcB family protein [Gemmatimonadetes bacterium]|nr:CrcB family protein [Gemmatimonadota bacterium]
MLTQIALVGLGGFLGSVGRYLLSLLVTQWSSASRFPAATLVVNVVGCLAIGALSGFATRSEARRQCGRVSRDRCPERIRDALRVPHAIGPPLHDHRTPRWVHHLLGLRL